MIQGSKERTSLFTQWVHQAFIQPSPPQGRTILPPILTTLYILWIRGEITKFEPLGILSTKTGQYYNYLIRPAGAVMEREQPRSRRNKDKIGGQYCWQKHISKQLCLTMHAQIFENSQNFAPMKHAQIACTDFQSFVIGRLYCKHNVAIAMCPLSPFLKPGHGWRVNFKADNISQWQDFHWSILVESILYIHVHLTPSPFKGIPATPNYLQILVKQHNHTWIAELNTQLDIISQNIK